MLVLLIIHRNQQVSIPKNVKKNEIGIYFLTTLQKRTLNILKVREH